MSKTISYSDSVTLVPSSIDSSYSYASISGGSNAYTESSSTTYATINLTTGSGATTYVYYKFDTSDIPAGATIDSITCSAKAYINTTNSSRITTRQIQLFSGTTAKGSAATISNSTTAFSITPGSWTRNELNDLRIRLYAVRGSSNTTTTYYFRFYGATVTINYSVNGTAYTVVATSEVDDVEASPLTQDVQEGTNAVVRIDAASIDDIVVKDNDNDVTSSLVQHEVETGATISRAPTSYVVSGSISGTRYQDTVGHTVENPSSQTGNDYSGSSGSTATIYYQFDFSDIPSNATIVSMTVRAYGHLESTSNSSEVAELNVYSGTTAKGTAISYTSTSSQTLTISPGTWTISELKDDPRVGFTIGYYGGLTTGITWTVEYEVPSTGNPYYWEYTLTNVSADHTIVVEQSGPFVPPEEDPTQTYYPVTISSINAVTDPHNGTTRVQAGTSETITITPVDPQLTLALDNGVDITSQLVAGTPTNTYTVTTQVSGASYGFNLNSSSGYYVSSNNGVAKSASVARLNLDFESSCIVTIQYINYAEAGYDYGLFGKLDTSVATDGLTAGSNGSSPSDSTSNYQLAMASDSTSTQTISYNVPSGEHYIDIKYGKDDASDSGNDSLQWKVLSIEATSAGGEYTYTLSNINQKHSLVFVFGDVDYYFVTSSASNGKIYPDGQTVILAGYDYNLTIVPSTVDDSITITDNGADRTSQLQLVEGQDKQGNRIVNYTYTISNVSAAHTLQITVGGAGPVVYLKINDTWRQCSAVYKKVNGSWVKQTDLSNLFDANTNYVKGGG